MSEKFVIANNYCREVFDGTHDTPKPSDHGYKLVTSKNIIGNKLDLNSAYLISQEDYLAINKRSKVSQFDVLFSMIGSVGNVYIEQRKNEEIDYSIKNIGVFSSKTEKEAYWLYYYLQSPYAQSFIKKFLNGAVQKFLPLQTLRAFPILSPVENYESIISILKNIDQKIALNNQINEELEAMAKTLYDYWFVQFDFPDENGKPYKSSGGKMVYNDQLKREIPEGWGVETLSDQISFDKTGDWGKEFSEGNYIVAVNCIRGTDINELKKNGILNSPKRYILKKNTHKLLDSYDIVIEISGGSPTQSTGRVGKITEYLFNRFENPIICSNFCKAIQLREKSMFYYFVAIWQSYYDSGNLFGWEGKTSGIKNLQFDSFTENTFIPLPEKKILEEFFYIGDEVEIKIQNNLKQNQELTQLRDWLLPMLMNGQVKVEEW